MSPGPMQTAQTLIRHSGLGHVDNWQYKYTMGTCVQQVQQQEPTKYVQAKNTHTLHKLNQSMTSLSPLGIICHVIIVIGPKVYVGSEAQ